MKRNFSIRLGDLTYIKDAMRMENVSLRDKDKI